MTKDEILELAKQAGFTIVSGRDTEPWDDSTKLLETFAALIESAVIKRLSAGAGERALQEWYASGDENYENVERIYREGVAAAVAAERLACAEMCDHVARGYQKQHNPQLEQAADDCAAAIRNRSTT